MDVSEKWGTSIDAAVDLALAELKLSIDQVDVTVLEQPSKGFFGIGSKLALVRVEKKKEEEKPVEKTEKKAEAKKNNTKPAVAAAKTAKKERKEKEVTKKPVKNESIPVKEEEAEEMFPVTDHEALSFLKEVTEQMGLNLQISAKSNDNNVYVDIQGKDSGTIIGKRGQTLDAIQYLTSLVVNKDKNNYVRVVVDAENYRAKREKTLEQLAKRLADKVCKTKKSVRLEPMNPYERKVIHATLQNNPRVTTRSEGQDPYRRVIIELK